MNNTHRKSRLTPLQYSAVPGAAQRVAAAVLFVVLLWGFVMQPARLNAEIDEKQEELTYRYLETFANVLSILQENYVEEIESKEAIEGAINGLLLSLDPHSIYLKPENYREFRNETNGSFTGIGIKITLRDGQITVIAPIADTPADQAGIRANDRILKIDGVSTKGKTTYDAVKILRGPRGSEVTISVFRDGWETPRDFTLIRSEIPLISVKSYLLKPGFGYLKISSFQRNTTKEFKEHLDNLQQERALQGVILDLRNNPGGLLDQAVNISDLFLDSGLIVYTRGRKKSQDLTYEAHDNNILASYPLVVLVNEGTASASEIVAGAVQDHRRGVIVGTRTFGKGSVQTVIPLNDGAGLKMTTARYYTPSGRSIQATGITPDVVVQVVQTEELSGGEASLPAESSQVREVDLSNHISSQMEENQLPDDRQPLSDEMQQLLNSDNQLQAAFDILKSLVLYASYKGNGVHTLNN
jgi:carboxyl-terminal processing protease